MKKGSFKKKSISILMCVLLTLPLIFTSAFFAGCETKKEPIVNVPTVESITLNTDSVKKTFAYGEAFNSDGLKVTATMSDKTTKDVPTADFKVTTPNMTSAGKRNVSVTYSGKSARYEITVMDRVIPAVDTESLLSITGENAENAYRVEAEAFKMATTGAKPATGDSFVVTAGNTTPKTSGDGKFLGNFGVVGNFFGFTFTTDKAYENVSMVLAMAYGGNKALALSSSMKMFLNYTSMSDSGEVDISTKSVGESVDALVWKNILLRNIELKAGANTLLFEVIGDNVPNMDYVDFYVGKNFISTGITISGKSTFTKEFEEFDLDKMVERTDLKFQLERANTNIDGTSKGTSPTGYTGGTEISTTLTLAKDATIRISMVAASVSDYKISEHWEFSIDGKVLDKVEDKNIQDGDVNEVGSGHYFWEWRSISLGKYNITAGDHLFIAKLNGTNVNVDMFKFEVLTYGSYLSNLDNSDVTINQLGTKHKVEAEEVEFSENKGRKIEVPTGNAYHITSEARAIKPKAIAGNKFGFSVYAEEASKVTLNIFTAYGGEGELAFDNIFRTKVDTATVLTGATLTKDEGEAVYADGVKKFTAHSAFNWNWKIVPITFDLTKGMHDISFTLKDIVEENKEIVLPSFDKFELIVTKYADGEEFTIPAIMKEDCTSVISGAGTYRTEAEKADNSGVALAKPNLDAGHPLTEFPSGAAVSATSGLSVGKLSTTGNTIKVHVFSDADYANVSIKFAMSIGNTPPEGTTIKADDLLSFKFNALALTAGDTAVFAGANATLGGWNWEPFTISGQTLKKGVNTLEITIKGESIGMNADYFEFIVA